MSVLSSATFVGGQPNMHYGLFTTDENGEVADVDLGSNGGPNAGAAVQTALRCGLVPAAPPTAGYVTAEAAATTAIAAIGSSPTQAEIQAALTAVLDAVSALTGA